eukprot:3941968-Rhodomonas_salina.3
MKGEKERSTGCELLQYAGSMLCEVGPVGMSRRVRVPHPILLPICYELCSTCLGYRLRNLQYWYRAICSTGIGYALCGFCGTDRGLYKVGDTVLAIDGEDTDKMTRSRAGQRGTSGGDRPAYSTDSRRFYAARPSRSAAT